MEKDTNKNRPEPATRKTLNYSILAGKQKQRRVRGLCALRENSAAKALRWKIDDVVAQLLEMFQNLIADLVAILGQFHCRFEATRSDISALQRQHLHTKHSHFDWFCCAPLFATSKY